MWSSTWYRLALPLLLILWSPDVTAIEPASALGDHMVLQRAKPVPIWGTATADAAGTWVPALSKIDGEKLIAWADGLKNPTDVRYSRKSIADEPFLYNKAGLPAAQFNTTTAYAIKD